VADFNYLPENPTDLDSILFSDKSQDFDGDVINWFWDFGDGNTSNEKNPNHNYIENGTYTITLNITDDDGAKQTTRWEIIIHNVAPIAVFRYSPDSPTTNDTISFEDFSRDSDGSIVSWFWNFGDGSKSEKKVNDYKYENEGTYTVSLTVVDNDGDYHTTQKFVTVFSDTKSEGGLESFIIYFIYIALFVIMIGLVFYIIKKYQEN